MINSSVSPGPRGSVDHTLTSMARISQCRCVLSNSQSATQGSGRLLIKMYKITRTKSNCAFESSDMSSTSSYTSICGITDTDTDFQKSL